MKASDHLLELVQVLKLHQFPAKLDNVIARAQACVHDVIRLETQLEVAHITSEADRIAADRLMTEYQRLVGILKVLGK